MLIAIPVPVAELFDKISILEIKKNRIKDPAKHGFVEYELNQLNNIVREHGLSEFLKEDLYRDLKITNEKLWDVCDLRRDFERLGLFDGDFISHSRNEYKANDRRAVIKSMINKRFNSEIVEVKSYAKLTYEEPLK